MAQERTPEFRLCACGLHGRIVRVDGILEMEVYSQKLARMSLAVAVEDRRIEARHCADLRRAIHLSGLPPTNDDIPHVLVASAWSWNHDLSRAPVREAPPCFTEGSS